MDSLIVLITERHLVTPYHAFVGIIAHEFVIEYFFIHSSVKHIPAAFNEKHRLRTFEKVVKIILLMGLDIV